ncbi:hypothetical protein [Novosphingobium sp.]|uniref:hypothetical protein n=1 Tax=Novosphingobium sp. TaxID=1874826 RepID=UPI002FDED0E4
MEYWIVFRADDGVELVRGSSPTAGTAAAQVLLEGQDLMVVPEAAVRTLPADLQVIQQDLHEQVDREAEAARSEFLTAGAGMALVYLLKQREAAALADDEDAPAPLLSAEAAAIGTDVATLAAQVRVADARWLQAAALIEAARRGAKVAISQATSLPALKAAASIDWRGVVSALSIGG